jgi:hypothetical protein
MQVKFAIVAPVTIPRLIPASSPNSSINQRRDTSTTTAAAGDSANENPFWSHVDVSQSAARAAGSAPPMTNPK